jgi:hypothetical protein
LPLVFAAGLPFFRCIAWLVVRAFFSPPLF